MNDHHDPHLLDHEADGIRELDNDLPRWWVWLFVITTIFGVIYMFYFHVFDAGKLQEARYSAEMERAEAARAARAAELAAAAPEAAAPLEPSTDAAVLAEGQALFMTHCLACHMAQGQGLVGPNLCDEYWIHGGNPTDVYETVSEGVPEKGMLSWKRQLRPAELLAMAAYVGTLQGSNPPDAKASEGDLFVRDPISEPDDDSGTAADLTESESSLP